MDRINGLFPPPLNLAPSSSDPPNFLDLTLAPFTLLSPKLEPKLEPLLDLDDLPLNPNLHLSPKPEPTVAAGDPADDPLPVAAAAASDDIFASLHSLQLYLRYGRRRPGDADALAVAVTPPPAAAAWRKPPPRSPELVRVTAADPRDQQHLSDVMRRTRATYESLRSLLLEGAVRVGELCVGGRGRADLDAAALMARHGLWLNRDKRIVGGIPGIAVGDIFFFRMELCVVGLHGQVQAGIDYVPASRSSTGEPIATSIVVSGGYEDDEDTGNVIVYTGHGGRERNVTRQAVDQRLESGNLALERSMNYAIEIRVIRGFKYDGSPSGRVYVYDGLYQIVDFWQDVGKSGFTVYKYKLVRIAGQEEMGSVVLKHAEDLKDKLRKLVMPVGYLSCDISKGKENIPVTLFNDIDDNLYPSDFDYLTRPVYPVNMGLERSQLNVGDGCQCLKSCGDDCSCAEKNGGEFAYDSNGILLMGKPLIYECGSWCRCPPSCRNRVTQKGLRNRLEVFRSLETEWAVRSLDLIRAGAFICEYSGIVLNKQQAELLSMNGDSLVHPKRFPNRWYEWGDISSIVPNYPRPMYPPLPPLDFSMDVSVKRNVACYFSQSCSPNVFLQFVLFDYNATSYPHLMVFAMENIPPLRELSIDYGAEDVIVMKSP